MKFTKLIVFLLVFTTCRTVREDMLVSPCMVPVSGNYKSQTGLVIDSVYISSCAELYFQYSGCDTVDIQPIDLRRNDQQRAIQLYQPFAGDCERLITHHIHIDLSTVGPFKSYFIDPNDLSVMVFN